jgi:hypothetical protein
MPFLTSSFQQKSDFRKSRNILTRSGGIIRGDFASCRYAKQIKWEAGIEEDAVTLIEFSSRILNVTSQPFKSVFTHAGKKTSRTPDFLIETGSEQILLECKPAEKLEDPEVREHLNIAKHHFESLGYRYHIATDLDIRSGWALKNAKFLLQYRMRPLQGAAERTRLLNQLIVIRSLSNLNIENISNALGGSTDVYALMASGYLHFDFHSPICTNTEISFQQLKEKNDAASFLFVQ